MSFLTETLERIFKHLQQYRPEVALLLKPGLTIEAIQSQIHDLPFCLPQEVYELYQWHNGIDYSNLSKNENFHLDINFIPGLDFLPLEEAIKSSKEIEEFRNEYTSPEDENCHKPWFPIFGSDDLEYLIVFGDSVNNENSPIMHCHLGGGSLPKFQYPNLITFMMVVAECYETNAYYIVEPLESNYLISYLNEDVKKVAEIERQYFTDQVESVLTALSQSRALLDDKIFDILYRFKDPRFLQPMIHALHLPLYEVDNEEENILIRIRAAIILGEIGDLRALEPLMRALEYRLNEDHGYSIANTVAEVLRKLGDPKAIKSLKLFLQKNKQILPIFIPSPSWLKRISLQEARKKAKFAIKELDKKNY
ncbi:MULTISPECIES: HEAT repeat domain-containing protein [Calothrix]|uniref:SMI1/KNR4 family protein n=2 Tax=Calothrix TaxID=1186 RepID=A0ABR8ACH9_9CYAN|nr:MULTISPECIES: HEAT repeat domain-containing protein [Calothrix]MBD2197706.1 SMI1/KNR4 family protein [Calothrix parietina FACHB-288]MBD2225635.1 SMI1/KNR4 family protein [Calothrix anomala FACHB-343]